MELIHLEYFINYVRQVLDVVIINLVSKGWLMNEEKYLMRVLEPGGRYCFLNNYSYLNLNIMNVVNHSM